ncbi:MAG: hypothetical protein J6I66_03475 [Lachnospiraceae bacterium]|nr:hypothetical protein [Lachnospiraceae bacterium]
MYSYIVYLILYIAFIILVKVNKSGDKLSGVRIAGSVILSVIMSAGNYIADFYLSSANLWLLSIADVLIPFVTILIIALILGCTMKKSHVIGLALAAVFLAVIIAFIRTAYYREFSADISSGDFLRMMAGSRLEYLTGMTIYLIMIPALALGIFCLAKKKTEITPALILVGVTVLSVIISRFVFQKLPGMIPVTDMTEVSDENDDASYEDIEPAKFTIRNEAGDILIDGDDVESAEAQTYTSVVTEYVVLVTFTEDGSQKLYEVTKQAMEDRATLPIYLDEELVVAPVVNSPISEGQCVITGFNSLIEAQEIADRIMAGINK